MYSTLRVINLFLTAWSMNKHWFTTAGSLSAINWKGKAERKRGKLFQRTSFSFWSFCSLILIWVVLWTIRHLSRWIADKVRHKHPTSSLCIVFPLQIGALRGWKKTLQKLLFSPPRTSSSHKLHVNGGTKKIMFWKWVPYRAWFASVESRKDLHTSRSGVELSLASQVVLCDCKDTKLIITRAALKVS